MSDALQVAHKRRQDYMKAIAKKESEISELNELISELNDFIEFGDALVNGTSAASETAAAPSAPNAVGKPTPKDAVSKPDDKSGKPMSADDNKQNLADVLQQRIG